jgi:hypothetical protein
MQTSENSENSENTILLSPNVNECDETCDDSDDLSTSSSVCSIEQSREKDRLHFDHTTFDALERILNLKVISHPLNRDFTKKTST